MFQALWAPSEVVPRAAHTAFAFPGSEQINRISAEPADKSRHQPVSGFVLIFRSVALDPLIIYTNPAMNQAKT